MPSPFLAALFAGALVLHAETGESMWLRYAPLDPAALRQARETTPAVIFTASRSPLLQSAQDELLRGFRGMLGRTLRVASSLPKENAILLGSAAQLAPQLHAASLPTAGAYWLKTAVSGDLRYTIVAGAGDRGVLYGAFALLRKIALGEPIAALDEKQSPYAPIRWVNQWDNLDGLIERGYGGPSFFWESGHSRQDLSRAGEYARLLASLGIDACAFGNVNADPRLLTAEFIPQIARIADALRPWGVAVVLPVDFGSPKSVGGLDTFDPLDPAVAAWWRSRADEVYRAVPDLAGFVLKADSEGRLGPSSYHRTHADAANVVARALQPHGGLLLYRGFVYDHHMDWRNPKNDRARAAYDNFHPLDGKFDSNVVVQIKNGPIDFQVREPASPLFGALEKTNQAIELQVTQEYMGQARHLVFLAPQWKKTLDFDEHARGPGTPAKALAAGRVFHRPTGGFVGVVNAGMDDNWFGGQMSQSNLYAFGDLAWDPNLSSARIASEWTRLTFGSDPKVLAVVPRMLLESWRAYEDYTGPLGLQTLTDIVGNHYGVSVEASERNGWGQWHRAGARGAGMDRSVATGTAFIGQYRPAVQRLFASLATCPDGLLLFFHHVPYTHTLHSGKTVIQSIYDSHYAGAAVAAGYVPAWASLRGHLDDERFNQVLAQLRYQAGQADVWRDAVTPWFLKAQRVRRAPPNQSGTVSRRTPFCACSLKAQRERRAPPNQTRNRSRRTPFCACSSKESAIPDAQGRVGHHPGRTEAEAMSLTGYRVVDVVPWEAASGGKAISCAASTCTAGFVYRGAPGWSTFRVEYFDQNHGVSRFRLFVGNQEIDQWAASDRLPSAKIDGTSSTRREVSGIALRPGDLVRIEAVPGGGEPAPLDYIDILPDRVNERSPPAQLPPSSPRPSPSR